MSVLRNPDQSTPMAIGMSVRFSTQQNKTVKHFQFLQEQSVHYGLILDSIILLFLSSFLSSYISYNNNINNLILTYYY